MINSMIEKQSLERENVEESFLPGCYFITKLFLEKDFYTGTDKRTEVVFDQIRASGGNIHYIYLLLSVTVAEDSSIFLSRFFVSSKLIS